MLVLLLATLSFAEEPSQAPIYDNCRVAVVVPERMDKAKKVLFVKLDLQGTPDFKQTVVVSGKDREFRDGQWGLLYTIPFPHAIKAAWLLPGVQGLMGAMEPVGPRPDEDQLASTYRKAELVMTDEGFIGPMYIIDAASWGCRN